MDLNKLQEFIHKAGAATYAGGGKPEKAPEREGFTELVYQDGDFSYRDSYTGFTRSRGMEVVRYQGTPVWSSSYGGGMVSGQEHLAKDTFNFLKKAMVSKRPGSDSFRGPDNLKDNGWEYKYQQEGNVEEFNGYEEIYFQGNLVFFHRIIGGTIQSKTI